METSQKEFFNNRITHSKLVRCTKKLKVLKKQGKLISCWFNDGAIYYICTDQPNEKCLFKILDLEELDFYFEELA